MIVAVACGFYFMASGDLSSNTSEEGDDRGEDFRSRSLSSAEECLSSTHSPETKRKNASLYLLSVSEEINNKKFPAIIKKHRKQCDPERQKKFYAWHWRVAIDSVIFLQRLKLAVRDHKQQASKDHPSDNSST